MATSVASKRAPSFVTRLNPIVNRMMGIGVPMGPNGLITVRGRTSGEPRTTPVAFVDIDGRTWVQSPFGDVNWVRQPSRRGGGDHNRWQAERGGQGGRVVDGGKGRLLSRGARPYIRRMRGGRFLARFLGFTEILNDPIAAADAHPVFELRRETAGA